MRSIALSLVLTAVVTSIAASEADPSTSFDYFYIEANEGDSSGGHAAIRFGDLTYHFQNQDGLIVLRRDFTREFIYTYALLSNRTIHSSRVGLSAATEDRLRRRFGRRHRIQQSQLEVLVAIREDRDLVQTMLDARSDATAGVAEVSLMVPGAGYFEADGETAEPSASIVALRERLLVRYGSDFLRSRGAAIQAELDSAISREPTDWKVALPEAAYDAPPHSLPWSERIVNLAAASRAIDVLEGGGALSSGAVRAPNTKDFALNASERAALAAYAKKLEARLVNLANSRREDWAPAFLAGMARLEALRRSLDSGFLVFLDSYADQARAIDRRFVARRPDLISNIQDEVGRHLVWARRRFVQQSNPSERDWAKLEERANRLFELQRGVSEQRDVRIHDGHLIPRRAAPVRVHVPLERSKVEWRESLARIRAREAAYRHQLESLYAYQLITRNCVSEIFATINQDFADSPSRSQREIGGYVDGYSRFAFVPFVSAREVNANYRVVARETIDSYRHARLREMNEVENRRWVALRESNTFTATSYDRSEFDSFFIFFTDGSIVLRPLLGAINVVAGLGETLLGSLRAPFDRGQTLVKGLKGTVVSLPELAFVNIRKGSNDWVAAQHRRAIPRD